MRQFLPLHFSIRYGILYVQYTLHKQYPKERNVCILKQLYFICNLHSGKAAVGAHLAEIIDQFTANDFQVTVHPTQEPGDAIRCAKAACDAGIYDILVCSGGDGTLNEVIQGCMASNSQCPIGYIPFGSTNDFARGLGIPQNPTDAVYSIIYGDSILCDVGSFNEKYFTYVAAFGALTEISYNTSQAVKNVLGHAAYILNGIAKLPKIRSCHMRIAHDGGVIEDEFLYGMVTNSSSVAKFLSLSEIQWDDGLFEVTLIRKPSSLIELQQLIAAFSKIQLGPAKQYLHYFRTSQLTITNLDDEPISWTIDGEYGGTERVNKICNYQKAVAFRIDPNRKKQAEETENGIAVILPEKQ